MSDSDSDSDYDADDNDLSELNEKGPDVKQLLHDEDDSDIFTAWNKCDKDLRRPRGIRKYLDFSFLRKFFRNLIPFAMPKLQMNFYLFKRDFPDCGREIRMDDNSVYTSGLNASHPTR